MGRYKSPGLKKLEITFFCHRCEKEITKDFSGEDIYNNTWGCGSHGEISIDCITCDCGSTYNFEINSW